MFGAIGWLLTKLRRGLENGLMNYDDRIVRDSKICGGEPVFKSTRVTLRTILASLAAGDSAETILAAFRAGLPKT